MGKGKSNPQDPWDILWGERDLAVAVPIWPTPSTPTVTSARLRYSCSTLLDLRRPRLQL